MSTEVSKVVYRVRLFDLEKLPFEDVVSYFREKLGEPEDVEEGWISYGNLVYAETNPTEFKDFVRPVRVNTPQGTQWGVEVVLGIMNLDNYRPRGWRPEVLAGAGIDLRGVVEGLVRLGFFPSEVLLGRIHAYTWYNGVDEPVRFD